MADRLHLIGMQCTASPMLSLPLIARQWLPIDKGRALINMEGKNTWWDIGGQKSDQSSSRLPPIQFQTDGSSEAWWPLGEAHRLFDGLWKRAVAGRELAVWWHVTWLPRGCEHRALRLRGAAVEQGAWRVLIYDQQTLEHSWTLITTCSQVVAGVATVLYIPQQIKLAMEAMPWKDRLEIDSKSYQFKLFKPVVQFRIYLVFWQG